ncbi:MAG: peptidase T [Spirochaetales bacterium]|nr:peptidase T [Spirochaetales bacterium]
MKEKLLERFVRYASIGTQSDAVLAESRKPSTPGQWDLLRLLEGEMRALGLSRVELTEEGFLFGHLDPSPRCEGAPSVGFMAHVDTASDAPGSGVVPRIHEDYDGGDLVLEGGTVLSPADFPALLRYKGDTIVTSSGETLLGADDKAGLAEIMAMADYFVSHPEVSHGPLEFIFTPDEETGCGMDGFPLDKLTSKFCYTVDGGEEGEVEEECYYAYGAEIRFTGVAIHPGYARGKLVNASSMAAYYGSLLPRSESPEATDGRYGNYWIHRMEGETEEACLSVMIRDFDREGMDRRLAALEAFARATEAAFPGGKVQVETKKQYVNMKEGISREPRLMEFLMDSLKEEGVDPVHKPIRGGTDGSRLTEMGIPTPNIYAGGHNFHSRKEWVPLSAMESCSRVLIRLARKWGALSGESV